MSDEFNNNNPNEPKEAPQYSYSFWAEQTTQPVPVKEVSLDYRKDAPIMTPIAPKKSKRVMTFFLKSAAFGIIASLCFIGTTTLYHRYFGEENEVTNQTQANDSSQLHLDPASPNNRLTTTTVTDNINSQSTDVSQVVVDTMPSIVAITSTMNETYDFFGYQYGQEVDGGGSGIIIGKTDTELLIATNNHVIEDTVKIMVTFIDGASAEAVIKGRKPDADLAVISIDTATLEETTMNQIAVARIGDSDEVKVGQMAIAIGNALGYGQSVTVGYISAINREIAVDPTTKMVVLQTDAAINPGNSGGALLNINGEVIGINSAKLADTYVEGIGYAIPITKAFPIVDELMNREILSEEEKGYLGVYPQDVDEKSAILYNWPVGAFVYDLVEDGAAKKAGIYRGDIITEVNGITIKTGEQLRELITSYRHGTTVTVTVMRFIEGSYVEKKFDVVLQSNTSITENTSKQNDDDSENETN